MHKKGNNDEYNNKMSKIDQQQRHGGECQLLLLLLHAHDRLAVIMHNMHTIARKRDLRLHLFDIAETSNVKTSHNLCGPQRRLQKS